MKFFKLSDIIIISVKQKAYRPPQARGTEASVKLHEYEAASDPTKKLNPGHSGGKFIKGHIHVKFSS